MGEIKHCWGCSDSLCEGIAVAEDNLDAALEALSRVETELDKAGVPHRAGGGHRRREGEGVVSDTATQEQLWKDPEKEADAIGTEKRKMRVEWRVEIAPRDENGGLLPGYEGPLYETQRGVLLGTARSVFGDWVALVLPDGNEHAMEVDVAALRKEGS